MPAREDTASSGPPQCWLTFQPRALPQWLPYSEHADVPVHLTNRQYAHWPTAGKALCRQVQPATTPKAGRPAWGWGGWACISLGLAEAAHVLGWATWACVG